MMQDRLLDAIGLCQAAALDGARWPIALAAVADYAGGVDTTLELRAAVDQAPVFFASGERLPDDGIASYLAHYSKICPRIPFLDSLTPGEVGCDHHFIAEAEMDRDEFYADFLAPEGLRYFMGASLRPSDDAANHIVAVHRAATQGHAQATDIARLRRLLPHLGMAVDTFLRLRGHAGRADQLLQVLDALACGVLLLDETGQVRHANAAVQALDRAGDGIRLVGGRLRPSDADAARALEAALARLLRDHMAAVLEPGASLPLPRPSGRPPLGLRLRRLPVAAHHLGPPPATLVGFIDVPAQPAPPDPAWLADALRLTRRQAELACALYAGQSLRQHAEARGIALSTARFHLYQLMARLDVARQQDLVRLIAALPAPAADPVHS